VCDHQSVVSFFHLRWLVPWLHLVPWLVLWLVLWLHLHLHLVLHLVPCLHLHLYLAMICGCKISKPHWLRFR
jgi:hypothetical protein